MSSLAAWLLDFKVLHERARTGQLRAGEVARYRIARDALARALAAAGVGTQVYYRVPLHRQAPLMECAEIPAGVPEAERAAGDVMALPMYPQLSEEHVVRVVEAVESFYRSDGSD
jgi:dTDP-4-amino-4,6-dideoxygalactose transaminase